MSERMSKREQRACDLIAWLHRHRVDYPDGFSGEALAKRSDWEEARFDGVLRLKQPVVTTMIQLPGSRGRLIDVLPDSMQHKALRAVHGARECGSVVTYTKKIGPARRTWNDPERVPMGLGHAPSTARFLGKLARQGVLELVPKSKPKRYQFPKARLVFGAPPAKGDGAK